MHWRDIMEHTGVCSVNRRVITSGLGFHVCVEGTMLSALEGYHESTGECSVHSSFYIKWMIFPVHSR